MIRVCNKKMICVAVLLALTGPCFAATITVNSTDDDLDDDGNCTLREAIVAANTNTSTGSMAGECAAGDTAPAVDEINFDGAATGTIFITSKLPTINSDIFVNGPGASVLAIDATNLPLSMGAQQVLAITPSASDVTIAGLTFQNAVTTTASPIGISGPTTIRDCIFQDNESDLGGAIRAFNDLTVLNSIFRRNTANRFGGGAVTMQDANRTLVVRDSLFEDNQTLGESRDGGAILVEGSDHLTTISGSTFRENHSASDGGALSIGGAGLRLENSTFFGNTAIRDGGAIELASLDDILANLTISNNTADFDDDGVGAGGGISQLATSSTITVRNTIIALNSAMGNNSADCDGSFVSDGYNLIGNGSGCNGFSQGVNGDQVGTATTPIDPLLLPLSDNGGPTPTMALPNSSPAVGSGNPAGCNDVNGLSLVADQRGEPRPAPSGTPCDIGAFETVLLPDAIFFDTFEGQMQ